MNDRNRFLQVTRTRNIDIDNPSDNRAFLKEAAQQNKYIRNLYKRDLQAEMQLGFLETDEQDEGQQTLRRGRGRREGERLWRS